MGTGLMTDGVILLQDLIGKGEALHCPSCQVLSCSRCTSPSHSPTSSGAGPGSWDSAGPRPSLSSHPSTVLLPGSSRPWSPGGAPVGTAYSPSPHGQPGS